MHIAMARAPEAGANASHTSATPDENRTSVEDRRRSRAKSLPESPKVRNDGGPRRPSARTTKGSAGSAEGRAGTRTMSESGNASMR